MKRDTRRPMVRQGDVLLIPVDDGPSGKRQKREGGLLILARGEATGHHHSIADRNCSLYLDEQRPISTEDARQMVARLGGGLIPDRLLVIGDKGATLKHQEHSAIALAPGAYICRVQREYVAGELARNVAD